MSRTVDFLKEDTDIFAGTTIVLPLRVLDDDLGTPAPIDISLWTFQYDQNDNEQNPQANNTLSKTSPSGGGIVVTNGPLGLLEVTLDPGDTSPAVFKTEHNHFWSLTRLTPTPIAMLGEGRIYIKGSPFSA